MRLLVFLLCLPCFVFSQDVSKQSIDSVLAIKGDNLTSFNTLLRKINQLPSDPSIANFKYIDSVIKDNDSLRLHTYMYYTSSLLRYGKQKEALDINTRGLKLAKHYNSPNFLFEYYQMRANIFDNKAILDSTLVYINKAESIINQNKTTLGHKMTTIYQQRAILEQKLGNSEKEDMYIEKIADVINAYPESDQNAFNLAMVVYHFKTKQNYTKHAYYAQKLKEYYIKKDGTYLPKSHESIEAMLKIDDVEEQIAELKNRINKNDSLNYSFLSPQIANMLGLKLIETGDYNDAVFYLKKALDYNKENLNPHSKILSFDYLYNAHYQSKDYKSAIEAYKHKTILQDSLRQSEMLEKIADIDIKYDTEKKTAEVKLLKAENKTKDQQKQVYLILALCGLIVASLFGYFAYKNKRQKLILAEQKEVLETTVEEKNMLFREIHHRVKNSLQMVSSLLFLQSENVKDTQAKNAIKDAQNRVRSLGLIHQKLYGKKHAIGVETKGYIEDLTIDIFNSHQLQSQNLDYKLNIESMLLSVDTLTPIGLIINELIVNILKHAFKETTFNNFMQIDFFKKEDSLILKVMDNGVGIDANVKRDDSFGLILINALSEKLEAEFSIDAIKPKGTEAILVIKDFEILNATDV